MRLIDPSKITDLKNLQTNTGQNLLQTLVEMYYVQISEAYDNMNKALKEAKVDIIKLESHSLKSSSAALGILEISEICRIIEDEVTLEKEPSFLKIKLLINKLGIKMSENLEELRILTQSED